MKMRLVNVFFALISFLFIAVLVLAYSPLGLPLAAGLVSALTRGELTLTGTQGRLIDELQIEKIDYQNESMHIMVDNAHLRWDGIRLLTGTVYIEHLTADNISVESFDTQEDETEQPSEFIRLDNFQSPYLSLIVDQFESSSLQYNHSPNIFTDIRGSLALNEQGLRFRNIHVAHPQFEIELQANIGPHFDPPIHIQAKEIFAFGKDNFLTGETDIEGDLSTLQGQHRFTEGVDAALDFTLKNLGPEFTLQAQGKADMKDLSQFDYRLSGEMHVLLQFDYDHSQGLGQVALTSDQSRVNNKDFKVDFEGRIKEYIVTWNNNRFVLGKNRLSTSGQYGADQTQISWEITAPLLAEFSDRLEGSLQSQGRYESNGQAWSADLNLQGKNIRWDEYSAEQLRVNESHFGSEMKHPLKLSLEGNNLLVNGFLIDSLDLEASGLTEKNTTRVTLKSYETELKARGEINLKDRQSMQMAVQDFSLLFPDQSTYQLKQASRIDWNDQGLEINPALCLTGPGKSSLCADNLSSQLFQIQLKDLPTQLVARYFTSRFHTTGTVNAEALFTFAGKQLEKLEATLNLSPMTVLQGRKKQRVFFETGATQFSLTADQDLLTSSGKIALIESDQIQWNLQVNDWHDLNVAKLTAKFTGQMTHWDPLRLFITDTNDFSGKAKLDLAVDGSVLAPNFKGGLVFHEGRLAIPSHGIVLEDGKLNLTPNAKDLQLHLDGSVRSGDGTVKVSGKVFLENTWPAVDLAISGERFILSNTDSALVYASPKLRVETHQKNIYVTGELHIPEATLNVKGYQSYIAPSPDIVILEDKPRVISAFYEVNTRVLLSLGRKISLTASQLKTGVEGALHVVKLGNHPVRATGQLYAVDGTYAAYGKKLDLSKAILTFNNSPLDNPSMFIEAQRQVQVTQASSSQYMFADPGPKIKNTAQYEGTVGIRISGTVQNPKYTFFSTPPMAEADQLSYLLTGGPSSQVGGASAAFMFAALTETSGMLGVSDTDAARLQNITRTIGIDFNIESGSHVDAVTGDTVSDTNLVVGKAIRPRLYVSYTVGLLDPMNMFRVRYQLSRRFALQTQTNTQGDTGGDILYGIETDRLFGIE